MRFTSKTLTLLSGRRIENEAPSWIGRTLNKMIRCHRRISNGTRRTPNVSAKALLLFKVFHFKVTFVYFFLFTSMQFIGTSVLRLLCANIANPGQYDPRNNRNCDCKRIRDRKIKTLMAEERTVASTSKMNSTWRYWKSIREDFWIFLYFL